MTSGDSERTPSTGPAPRVHPTAILEGDVQLANGVTIGPYCVVTGPVRLGEGTKLLSHTVVQGATTVGRDCVLGPSAAIGMDPSARAYKDQRTQLILGDRVQAKEFTSLHRSIYSGDEHATRIGDDCLLMPTAHVGHDSQVGRNVVIANGTMLGGHVIVGDNATLGGGVEVHQFVRIGRLAMIGGGETVLRDVLPFGIFRGGQHRAYNAVGVRRFGFDPATVREVRRVLMLLQRSRTYAQAAKGLRTEDWEKQSAVARELVEFIETSKRGLHAHAGGSDSSADE